MKYEDWKRINVLLFADDIIMYVLSLKEPINY